MKQRVNLSIEQDIHKKFKQHCQKRGMKMSSKVELFMANELKKGKK